jgi:hypothetical protein
VEVGEKTAVLEFEQVRQEYAVEDARGIPMSVREWYDKALSEMRRKIRAASNNKAGKKLGDLLLETGAVTQEQLQTALTKQEEDGAKELLGEVLLSLGAIQESDLISVLRKQAVDCN